MAKCPMYTSAPVLNVLGPKCLRSEVSDVRTPILLLMQIT